MKYSLLASDGGYFSLDEFSGILRLERPLTPDSPPSFELKVKATDRGLPRHLYSVATVTVDVVSLDNYQPVFLSSEYTTQLPESAAVGSEVLSVSALTRDGGGPDPVVYRIVSGNEDGRFLLDARTGWKILSEDLKKLFMVKHLERKYSLFKADWIHEGQRNHHVRYHQQLQDVLCD